MVVVLRLCLTLLRRNDMFALEHKKGFGFICMSRSEEELDRRIRDAYNAWFREKFGEDTHTFDDFMQNYNRVRIKTIRI